MSAWTTTQVKVVMTLGLVIGFLLGGSIVWLVLSFAWNHGVAW